MSTLIPELFDLVDQGIGVFTSDTRRLVECNRVLKNWLALKSDSELLSDHMGEKDLARLKKAIEKGRIFRIKKEVTVVSRIDNIDFKIQVVTLSPGKRFLMVQGIVNNSERESHRIMKEYSMINEKNKKTVKRRKRKSTTGQQSQEHVYCHNESRASYPHEWHPGHGTKSREHSTR